MYRASEKALASLALIGVLAAPAVTHAQHVDALLIIDPNNKMVTGGYDFDLNVVDNVDTRVYEGEFDSFGTIDEPGFNALSSTNPQIPPGFSALPGNTPVNFTGKAFTHNSQTSNLWYWDATGPVNFTPVTGGTELNVSKSPSSIFSVDFDGSASDVAGFTIDTTNASGLLHKHIDFSMNIPTAPDGFYLWSFVIDVGAYSTEPIYFVHGLGEHDEELHEAAIGYVEANIVPEPASFALLGLAAAGALARRRRGA